MRRRAGAGVRRKEENRGEPLSARGSRCACVADVKDSSRGAHYPSGRLCGMTAVVLCRCRPGAAGGVGSIAPAAAEACGKEARDRRSEGLRTC